MPRSTLPVEITNVNPMTNEATISPLSSQLVVVRRHASRVSNAKLISIHFFCHADGEPRPSATPKGCALQESSHSSLRLADLAAVPISRPRTVASTDGPSCSGGKLHRPRQVPFCSPKGHKARESTTPVRSEPTWNIRESIPGTARNRYGRPQRAICGKRGCTRSRQRRRCHGSPMGWCASRQRERWRCVPGSSSLVSTERGPRSRENSLNA